jgi:hypothetical protein
MIPLHIEGSGWVVVQQGNGGATSVMGDQRAVGRSRGGGSAARRCVREDLRREGHRAGKNSEEEEGGCAQRTPQTEKRRAPHS